MFIKSIKKPRIKSCQISLLIFISIRFSFLAIAQEPEKLGLDSDMWAVELSRRDMDEEVNNLGSLIQQLIEVDSLRAFMFLDSLENSPKAKGYYFKTHFCMTKAEVIYAKFARLDKFKDRSSAALIPIKEQLMELYADALDAVYQTEYDKKIGCGDGEMCLFIVSHEI